MFSPAILSLTIGIRTEEARALRWDHVDLDGDPDARLPVPPSIAVRRSIRLDGDTKTEKSRRPVALPQNAVTALREHRKWQAEARPSAGPLWQDTGLVFATSVRTPLDASHVRRDFRALCKKAGVEGVWALRELRHTFVSASSVSGVAVEKIARLAGHSSSRTTEVIYHFRSMSRSTPSRHRSGSATPGRPSRAARRSTPPRCRRPGGQAHAGEP